MAAKPAQILTFWQRTKDALHRLTPWLLAFVLLLYKAIAFLHSKFGWPFPAFADPTLQTVGAILDGIAYGVLWIPATLLLQPIVAGLHALSFHVSFDALFSAWRDFAILSFILSRLFDASYIFVPADMRAKAISDMTPDMLKQLRTAEGLLWGPHQFLESLNRRVYLVRDWIAKRFTSLIRALFNLSPPTLVVAGPGKLDSKIAIRWVANLATDICAALFAWGLIKFFGYAIALWTSRNLNSPRPLVWRKMGQYFALNVVLLVICTALFYFTNIVL